MPPLCSDPPEWSQYAVLVSGWPAPAVWAGRAVPPGEPWLDESTVVQPFRRLSYRQPWRSLGLYPDRTPSRFPSIPWRPLWPGFLINSGVMWGVLLMVAVCRVWIVRARNRRRLAAGFCPSCHYDVSALPPDADARITCPECGGVWKAKLPNGQMTK
ncbi:MAG: hypothetical protein IPK69_03635 [Phycisphaerales bacterium]|nr:MAG: hypothetical protein IPK69_03635 [Phycisphaerales bacterium]